MNNKKTYLVWLFFIGLLSINAQQNSQLWQEVSDSDTSTFTKSNRSSQPTNYKLFELDLTSLKNKLANVKSRNQSTTSNIIISFPNDEGNLERFRVYETEIMHPDLAIKYPMIKSYVAQGIDDLTATMNFTVTQFGLHAMTFSGNRSNVFIDTYTTNANYYIVYTKSSVTESTFDFECFTDEGDFRNSVTTQEQTRNDTDDKKLRTFRLALSCTAEYGNIFAVNAGTEKADIMAQMVITMNRVNGVYEKDLAITMQFVANNDLLLYYGNTGSDPWNTEYNATTQIEIDDKIGDGNYDIGHNFNTSGGGNAGCIGCICTSGTKGRGYTGRPNPTGDPFDIDYVAHEMGHQFGGFHTMNTCSRSGNGFTEVEPASGSAIMSYAGICDTNVQANSDAHFNYVSIRDISANVQGGVSTCAAITNLVNNPPTANAGSNYTIPRGTAYVLEGVATDPEGLGSLTYSWSQNDPERSPGNGTPQPTYAVGPLYRTLYPTSSPNRYMPNFDDVLTGNLTPTWEVTPSVGRNMEFAFLVRDNDVLGGQTAADLMSVTVDGGSGPFQVTSQGASETWESGSMKLISWNVASTNTAPVNASNVDILITDDGGVTFTSVATNVPNTGSYNITVPNISTSTARIMVRGSNNIFYAINSANITIQQIDFEMDFNTITSDICAPNNAVYTFTYNSFASFNEIVTFSASGNPVGSTVTFNPTQTNVNGTLVTMTVSNITNAMEGNYTINVEGTSTSANQNVDVTLNVVSSVIPVVTLTSPANNSTNILMPVTLDWTAETATTYDIQIASDNAFTTIVENATVNTNSYTTNSLSLGTTYYWRVRVNNLCGIGTYVTPFNFSTQNCTYCASTYSNVSDDWITNVTLNNINNASGQGGSGSYEDFSAISTDLEIGLTYPISIDVEVNGNFTQYVKVFIDWNQDCDFDDVNETLDLGSQFGSATFNGNINVPIGAIFGNTKMRIIEQYQVSPEACNIHPNIYGETEDYTINVIAANSCLIPTNVNVTNVLDVSAIVNWTDSNSPSDGFNIEYVLEGSAQGSGTMLNVATTSVNLIGLLSNTVYDVYVQADCGAEESQWTVATTFTTLCGIYSDSYIEEFESSPLDCWTFYESEGDDPGFVQTNVRAHNGSFSYRHNRVNIATASESWMISPGFLSGVNDELHFWYNQDQTNGSNYNYSGVWISTTGNDPLINPGDWTELSELNAGSTGGLSEDTWTEFVQNLSAYVGETIYIGFRYVGDNSHRLYIDDYSIIPVSLCTGVTKTWDGTDWLDGGFVTTAPDLTNPVIINGTYTTGTHGNINACNLVNNATLTVSANTYVNVIYDIVNTDSFTIEPQGSLVQIENLATVTGAGTFNTQVSTTALVDKNRFTYFSSPATNNSLTVFDAWSNTNALWEFVGSSQLWNNIPNTSIMQNAYGYAVKGNASGSYPLTATTTFSNAFNNGIYTLPLYHNVGTSEPDSTDDDSVLLGNPYPSAIDAAMLLTNNPQANAFYIWTHASPLGSGAYVQDDYIIWNASGGIASASGEPALGGFIASGQGFFVESNAAGTFTFSNTVRVTSNNNDFRSQNNNDARLWLDLTTSTGLFKQLLLAFSPQATNQFDAQKDAKRLVENTNLSFYSFDEVSESFAIQTRKEVVEEDIIPLGFHVQDTSVNQMEIAISTIEFFEDTNVYLRDNVLNVIHDLKLTPYNFTLIDRVNNEERFELILNRDALGTTSDSLNNDLLVYMIEGDLINIQMTNSAIIKQVKIYDVLGKMLTNLKTDNSIIKIPTTVNTGTILFLNITLENGQSLIKKMIVNK